MARKLKIINLGTISYQKAFEEQDILMQNIINHKKKEKNDLYNSHYLIICQHPPVITLGKNGKKEHLLYTEDFLKSKGISFSVTNRGGDITYHGPGQLVAYPILNLEAIKKDISWYLRSLEKIIIEILLQYNIEGDISPGETGVWLDVEKNPRKICAMGIRMSRWVTMHGLAFNINTNLSHFDYIVPCGIRQKKVTSLEKELKTKVDFAEIEELFIKLFIKHFQMELV